MSEFSIKKTRLPSVLYQLLILLMRILFGAGWIMAGVTKITGKAGEISWYQYPGQFLSDYFSKALAKPNVPDFYKYFIEHFCINHTQQFNYVIPIVQIIVGVCMIVGFMVIPSLLTCMFMHINFILSGNMNLISLTLYTSTFVIFLNLNKVYVLSIDRYLGIKKRSNQQILSSP